MLNQHRGEIHLYCLQAFNCLLNISMAGLTTRNNNKKNNLKKTYVSSAMTRRGTDLQVYFLSNVLVPARTHMQGIGKNKPLKFTSTFPVTQCTQKDQHRTSYINRSHQTNLQQGERLHEDSPCCPVTRCEGCKLTVQRNFLCPSPKQKRKKQSVHRSLSLQVGPT